MTDRVTIADAIGQLRSQLTEAIQEGKDKPVRFLLKNVEVELALVFKTAVEGGGGIKAWFLDISGKASKGDETTHRVKLTLDVVGNDGKSVQISDFDHEQ
jgi:hypothetical protein